MKQHITKSKARELYKDGMSTRKIAKELNIGHVTVYRWCKDIIRTKSESLKGEKHPLWKFGHIDDNGYRKVWINGKLRGYHRIIADAPDGMDVHHINGNKLDNRPENLVLLTRSEHTILHNKQGNPKVKGRKYGFYSPERRLAISKGLKKYYASAHHS